MITVNSDSSLQNAIGDIRELYNVNKFLRITLKTGKSRTLDQNAMLWRLLSDLSSQVDWYGSKLTQHEWKDVMTAGLKRSRIVPGIDGGFVVVGASTSRMAKSMFSELIELIFAFGAQHGVVFSGENENGNV